MYILDTDEFTMFTYGHTPIAQRVFRLDVSEVAISIVTVEEILTGWYSALRQAKTISAEIQAYSGLFRAARGIQMIEVIPFSPDAVHRFHNLRKQYRRLGRMDLAIAAICLEFNTTLVTRNRIDFAQIAGLKIEDWSQPQAEGQT